MDAAEDMMSSTEDGPGLLQFDKDGNLIDPEAEKKLFGAVLVDSPQKHRATRKPRKCPSCGEKKVVEILYGYPTPEAELEVRAGQSVLGGCCIDEDDPRWQCTQCGAQIWGPRREEPR
jgi:predicted RNA-binding Zn-ribbon protein involved in translation (DUF1610 family)